MVRSTRKLGFRRVEDPERCFCGDVNGWKKLVREIRAFIRNFYAKLSVLVKVCLERELSREFVGRTEGELKVHGDDFPNEFQDLLGESEIKFILRNISKYLWWRVTKVKFWKFNIYSPVIKQFRNDILYIRSNFDVPSG